jgi:hypothetical protein
MKDDSISVTIISSIFPSPSPRREGAACSEGEEEEIVGYGDLEEEREEIKAPAS